MSFLSQSSHEAGANSPSHSQCATGYDPNLNNELVNDNV